MRNLCTQYSMRIDSIKWSWENEWLRITIAYHYTPLGSFLIDRDGGLAARVFLISGRLCLRPMCRLASPIAMIRRLTNLGCILREKKSVQFMTQSNISLFLHILNWRRHLRRRCDRPLSNMMTGKSLDCAKLRRRRWQKPQRNAWL